MVRIDGAPVGPGTLMFEPVAGGATVTGFLLDDGSYTLRSGEKMGAPIGEYKVTIVGGNSPDLGDEAEAAVAARRNPIPPAYGSVDAGLTAIVEPGKQSIDFELEPVKKKRRR